MYAIASARRSDVPVIQNEQGDAGACRDGTADPEHVGDEGEGVCAALQARDTRLLRGGTTAEDFPLAVSDALVKVVGTHQRDRLTFGGERHVLDLTAPAPIVSSIEEIDLTGSGNNALLLDESDGSLSGRARVRQCGAARSFLLGARIGFRGTRAAWVAGHAPGWPP